MDQPNKSGTAFAILCLLFSAVFAISLFLSGFGTHMGWWGFRRGLTILRWSAYAEAIMVLLSLAGCVISAMKKTRTGLTISLIACVIAFAAVILPVRMWMTFRSVPMIHDITTDMDNPPRFDAVLNLRRDAQNPAEYGGADVASLQRKAYPDIAPLLLDAPYDAAFQRSLKTAQKMGWEIVHADAGNGIIEATDTTFWFRFKDDIVVRITPSGSQSRIDVRSVSRVGKSDVGTNACRIRAFLNALKTIST
jgi:uncharacterized protein (DUF1499 family)